MRFCPAFRREVASCEIFGPDFRGWGASSEIVSPTVHFCPQLCISAHSAILIIIASFQNSVPIHLKTIIFQSKCCQRFEKNVVNSLAKLKSIATNVYGVRCTNGHGAPCTVYERQRTQTAAGGRFRDWYRTRAGTGPPAQGSDCVVSFGKTELLSNTLRAKGPVSALAL